MRQVVETLHVPGSVFVGLFDACRNNPFSAAEQGGLARLDNSAVDTLVAYSTAPGGVAYDGQGRNSPFAEALIEALGQDPNRDVNAILTEVRFRVVQQTNGKQVPFSDSSLSREVSFLSAEAAPASIGDGTPATSTSRPPLSDRLQASTAFSALGEAPGREALVAWLANYEQVLGVEPLVDRAYSRLNSILVAQFEVVTAASAAGEKGGVLVRNTEPPAESVLSRRRSRKALLIGINDYEDLPSEPSPRSTLADLHYAEEDARAFEGVLASGRMGDWQTELLAGRRADQRNAQRTLKELFFQATVNDVILVFFSGHGSRDTVETTEHFLMFQDSISDDATTGINFRTLERWIASSKAGHVIVIVDACRSGFVAQGAKGGGAMIPHVDQDQLLRIQLAKRPNRVIFTSSRGDQTSWEDETLGQGIFTHYLIDALRGAAGERAGPDFVDLGEVYDYTHRMVIEHSVRTVGMAKQEPSIREVEGNAFSDFPVAYR
jgi:uncharacterized caspase-like protein